MSKKKKSAKKKVQPKVQQNVNTEIQQSEDENKITVENEVGTSSAEQVSEQTEPTQKKDGKERVVEVRAKDVAKSQKKDKKNKKPNKMTKALKDTGNELKRISWPPFKQVVKQTSIVLVFVIVFAVILFGFDQLCIWLTSFLY